MLWFHKIWILLWISHTLTLRLKTSKSLPDKKMLNILVQKHVDFVLDFLYSLTPRLKPPPTPSNSIALAAVTGH